MFCEKCGARLPKITGFCPNCGTNYGQNENNEPNIDDGEVKLNVKPKYNFGYMFLYPLIALGVLILVIAVATAIMFNIKAGGILFLIGFSTTLVILLLKAPFDKGKYDAYSYNFYKTKAIYQDNFLGVSQKEIKYKYIREVTMSQSFMQKYFNIGDIILYTSAETGYASGIFIIDVENVQNVYSELKSIINL